MRGLLLTLALLGAGDALAAGKRAMTKVAGVIKGGVSIPLQ